MSIDFDRLARFAAPQDIQSMARLAQGSRADNPPDTATSFLAMVQDAARLRQDKQAYAMLPEFEQLLALDQQLPDPLRLPISRAPAARAEPGVAADGADTGPRVVRTLEGITPWLFDRKLRFPDALALADDPSKWSWAAPQMAVTGCQDVPARNGALWRRRLSKTTCLAWPFQTDLITRETIEITAQGHDGPRDSGHRRYSHFLVSAQDAASALRLSEDAGWIEMSGDRKGTQIRIFKRVTVSLPRSLDEKFGSCLPLGFSTLLWLWGLGFFQAARAESGDDGMQSRPGPSNQVSVPSGHKSVVIHDDGKGERFTTVAVLGGGPAGLACAWLLSNPQHPDGRRAWHSPDGLTVRVKLVEQRDRCGGKAAAHRAAGPSRNRIEEHGLHVVMGFYANLREMLRWSTAGNPAQADPFAKVFKTRVLDGSSSDPTKGIELRLSAWRRRPQPASRLLPLVRSLVEQHLGPDMQILFTDTVLTNAQRARLKRKLDLVSGMLTGQGWGNIDLYWAWRIELLKAMPLLLGDVECMTKDELTQGNAVLSKVKAQIDHPDPAVGKSALHMIRMLMLAVEDPGPRPLLRAALGLWSRVAQARKQTTPETALPQPQDLALQQQLRTLSLAAITRTADAAALMLMQRFAVTPPAAMLRHDDGGDVQALADLLRTLARSALPADDPDPEIRLVSELVELSATIAIGLDLAGIFPEWAIAEPSRLLDKGGYGAWVRQAQDLLDGKTLEEWLNDCGVTTGFVNRSAILNSVTAGLFATPQTIAAGTFVNGLARLLLTYEDAPYLMLRGGTQEAVIDPIFSSFAEGTNSCFHGGTTVLRLNGDDTGIVGALAARTANPQESQELPADAFVLALPPFDKAPIPGLPSTLATALRGINSRATVGLQHWTSEGPLQESVIISGLSGALRCAAPMTHLAGEEGNAYTTPPVYYCGDVEDEVAKAWQKDQTVRAEFVANQAARFQAGVAIDPPFVSANWKGCARYVSADPETQSARRYVFEGGAPNLWLAGDWTRTALSCGSIEAAMTSGLEAARDILKRLGCIVEFPIAGSILD